MGSRQNSRAASECTGSSATFSNAIAESCRTSSSTTHANSTRITSTSYQPTGREFGSPCPQRWKWRNRRSLFGWENANGGWASCAVSARTISLKRRTAVSTPKNIWSSTRRLSRMNTLMTSRIVSFLWRGKAASRGPPRGKRGKSAIMASSSTVRRQTPMTDRSRVLICLKTANSPSTWRKLRSSWGKTIKNWMRGTCLLRMASTTETQMETVKAL